MQAVLCHAFGDPSAIRLGEIDAPRPKRGELLVDVHAAAVSFMDTLMTAGKSRQLTLTVPLGPANAV